MKEETKLWFDLANEDHESAVLLWKNHRYGLSVFLSQQALEKMLKFE
ncbi:MAG: HEPN domain-containing protein [Patescibacteria group bacterium]